MALSWKMLRFAVLTRNKEEQVMKRVKVVYTIVDYVNVTDCDRTEQDCIDYAREVSGDRSLNDMECVDVECFVE